MNATAQESRAELTRVALWPLTNRAVRAAVLMMAGLPRERVDDRLDAFAPDERSAIWHAAATLERDANTVAQCAERKYVTN